MGNSNTASAGSPAYIIDKDGDIVWATMVTPDAVGVRMSVDAQYVWINCVNLIVGASNGSLGTACVHRAGIDGEKDEDLSSKFVGLTHQLTVMPDDNILFYAYSTTSDCFDIKEYNVSTGAVQDHRQLPEGVRHHDLPSDQRSILEGRGQHLRFGPLLRVGRQNQAQRRLTHLEAQRQDAHHFRAHLGGRQSPGSSYWGEIPAHVQQQQPAVVRWARRRYGRWLDCPRVPGERQRQAAIDSGRTKRILEFRSTSWRPPAGLPQRQHGDRVPDRGRAPRGRQERDPSSGMDMACRRRLRVHRETRLALRAADQIIHRSLPEPATGETACRFGFRHRFVAPRS